MIDKMSGKVAYAVISFGGFLGLGHSHYPVPWGKLAYDTSLGGFRTDITEQQLKDAPEFSDDSWGDRDWDLRSLSKPRAARCGGSAPAGRRRIGGSDAE